MSFKYQPLCIQIPQITDNILNYDPHVIYSTTVDYPRLEYGFHHFIEQTREKMEYIETVKRKLFLILTDMERYIDDYNESVGNIETKYFELDKKPKLLSRAFYKIWELLMCFNLINPQQKKFVSAHLAEGPGSFIQATMFYRELYGKNSKTDKYYGITLDPESDTKNVPALERNFTDYYMKEKPQRFYQHETVPKAEADKNPNKDNGDLTDPKTIKLFQEQIDEKADFVTADGGFQWEGEETIQEQKAYFLIIGQIISAFKVQKKGGNFICKFFETYTKSSMKAISILSQCYEEVYFMKPIMSRIHNSEKYIVCLKFKYDEKDSYYKKIDKKLDDLLLGIRNKPNELFVIDIFPEYQLEKSLTDAVAQISREIANHQFKTINEMAIFTKQRNYYGEMYQKARDHQIDVTKFWIDMYLPKISQYAKQKELCIQMKNYSNESQQNKLIKY